MLGVLDLGIDLDAWPWIWLVTAVVFALIELTVVGGSFIILPWAISAFIAAILAFYDVPIEIQWAVFVFGGLLLFAALYKWAQGFMQDQTTEPGVGAERLTGLTGTVTVPIDPTDTDRKGRVTIQGEVWGVVDPVRPYELGERVRVTGVRGTRVVVEPIENIDTSSSDPSGQGE
jgi:membrane protein implicated in regulation of membrane protease activity